SLDSLLRETGRQGMPIDVRPQMLYNPAMRAPNFFVPGVIGVVLQIGTTVAAAMALVRERERGTLEQLLVSPLSRAGLMLGTLFPTTYFIALMRAIILRGALFFEYWPNLAVLILMSILLFAFCALRFRTKIA